MALALAGIAAVADYHASMFCCCARLRACGDGGLDRTADFLHAMQALSFQSRLHKDQKKAIDNKQVEGDSPEPRQLSRDKTSSTGDGIGNPNNSQSWQMEHHWKPMSEGRFDFGFAVEWMRKDLSICLNEARRNGASLPGTALIDNFFAEIEHMGGERWDTSSLLARLAK